MLEFLGMMIVQSGYERKKERMGDEQDQWCPLYVSDICCSMFWGRVFVYQLSVILRPSTRCGQELRVSRTRNHSVGTPRHILTSTNRETIHTVFLNLKL